MAINSKAVALAAKVLTNIRVLDEDGAKAFLEGVVELLNGSGGGSSIPAPPNDGNVWAWSGNEWVRICPEGYNVEVSKSAAASALSLPGDDTKVITSKNEENNG